jgi:hypothetical protein
VFVRPGVADSEKVTDPAEEGEYVLGPVRKVIRGVVMTVDMPDITAAVRFEKTT